MKDHGKAIGPSIADNKPLLTKLIQQEPMLFGSDAKFADMQGGPLTNLALVALEDIGVDRKDLIVDTRSHMLKPGWYPAIPGWHCDEVPRGKDGQPDIDLIPGCHDDRPRHYLIVLDAGTNAMTHFLNAKCRGYMALDEGLIAHSKAVQLGEPSTVWGQCDRVIRQGIDPEHIERTVSGHLYEFSQFDFHTATPATGDGWRWFFRATTKSKRPVANEIRRQVQVYLGDVNGGW
ncbi:hypothetical protein R5W60_06645 [Brucella pseudintermedia]|uniref:hypothetical protein n=1 Tax=Brucella pseudintermedia TaxID=370111 RepID=UPI003670C563|nr:hypothetical protein R5W60_06645 [Brucella pseudintermedia]